MLAFILTLFCAVFIINFLTIDKDIYADDRAKASSDTYLIEDDNFYSDYSNYTNFEINSLAGLKAMGSYCYDRIYTWKDKNVKLTANIDCKGESISIGRTWTPPYGSTIFALFDGTFDGNGFSIYNFNVGGSYSLGGQSISGAGGASSVSAGATGLFSRLGSNAIIKNLRLSDLKTTTNNVSAGGLGGSGSTSFVAAGLVAYAENGAIIEKCCIENFEHISDTSIGSTGNNSGYAYQGFCSGLSGIVAAGYGKISNCYVGNISTTYIGDKMSIKGIGPSVTKIALLTSSYTTFNSEVSYCISNNYNISILSSTNSYSSPGETSGLSSSSEGGEVGTTWYYGGQDYNSGYPYLRQFIKDWTTLTFNTYNATDNEPGGGSVTPTSIEIPKGATYTAKISDSTIRILEQPVNANAYSGFDFVNWDSDTLTANFEREKIQIKFNNASGTENGDEIIPHDPYAEISQSGGIFFDIFIGTEIIPSHPDGTKGAFTLIYKLTDISGREHEVKYDIPSKYKLKKSNHINTTVIYPTLEVNTYNVKFLNAIGSSIKEGLSDITIKHGEKIEYDNSNITFTCGDNVVKYSPIEEYKFDYLIIKLEGVEADIYALSSITGDLEIQPVFTKWYKVKFEPAKDENGNVSNNASITSAIKEIEVKAGDTIFASGNESRNLTYSYGGNSVSYQANKFYRLLGSNVTPTDDITITPIVEFWACEVTFGGIDSSIGTRDVKNDTWGDTEEELKDGIFAVEFGTTVSFEIQTTSTPGLFKYVYTFSSGEVVTYEITNILYAIEYILNETTGDRTGIKNGLNEKIEGDVFTFEEGEESKSITPTFSLKQIWGGLA